MIDHRIRLNDEDLGLIIEELEAYLPTTSGVRLEHGRVLLARLKRGRPGNPTFNEATTKLPTLVFEQDDA